jgi:hypothetical protein
MNIRIYFYIRERYSFYHLTQVGPDEGEESTNTGIDTRLTSLGAAITPGDDADELTGRSVDERATGVTLA